MKALREVNINLGIFAHIPIKMFKADAVSDIKLKSVCSCGNTPKMRIECEKCNANYTSWQKVPNRAYQEIILTQEELLDLKPKNLYESLNIDKVVSFRDLAIKHNLGNSFYLLPDASAEKMVLKAYNLIVFSLAQKDWAMLSKLTTKNKTKRYAIISNGEVLCAYELNDKRDLPYDVDKIGVNEAELNQAVQLLESSLNVDVSFEDEENPLLELIEKKIKGNEVTA